MVNSQTSVEAVKRKFDYDSFDDDGSDVDEPPRKLRLEEGPNTVGKPCPSQGASSRLVPVHGKENLLPDNKDYGSINAGNPGRNPCNDGAVKCMRAADPEEDPYDSFDESCTLILTPTVSNNEMASQLVSCVQPPVAQSKFQGFTTPSNKMVGVSEASLAAVRQVMDPWDDEETVIQTSTSVDMVPEAPLFVGFMTASNKKVEISDAALIAARQKLDDWDDEDVTVVEVDPQIRTTPTVEPIPFAGFMTANNKKVDISDSALAAARQKFDDGWDDDEIVVDPPKSETQSVPPTHVVGLMTASNKKVEVSEAALAAVRSRKDSWSDEDETVATAIPSIPSTSPPFVGFMTASNKKVEISEVALAAARQKMDAWSDEEMELDTATPFATTASANFRGFLTATNKRVAINEDTLVAAREKIQADPYSSENATESVPAQGPSAPAVVATFAGFMTATNKKVEVSETALTAAREKMETWDEDDKVKTTVDHQPALPPTSTPFVGFVTANNKKVDISEAALMKARKRFSTWDADIAFPFTDELSDDVFLAPNSASTVPVALAPSVTALKCESNLSTSPRTTQQRKGFISPLISSRRDTSSPTPQSPMDIGGDLPARPCSPASGRPQTPKSRFVTPFRKPSFVSPMLKTSAVPSTEPPTTPLASASAFFSPSCTSTPATVTAAQMNGLTFESPISRNCEAGSEPSTSSGSSSGGSSSRRLLHQAPHLDNWQKIKLLDRQAMRNADVRGFISKIISIERRPGDIVQSIFELKDETGEVRCDMFSKSPSTDIELGNVLEISGALLKLVNGATCLHVTIHMRVRLNPKSPDADRLRRLNEAIVRRKELSTSKGLSYSDLFLIDKLDPEKQSNAFVKGYITEFPCDNLTYFGCCVCKRKMIKSTSTGDLHCMQCNTDEGRHFFAFQCDVADFSGSIRVTVFDEVASRIIGHDGDENAKISKYRPEQLRQKLRNLEFSEPLILRLRLQNRDGQNRWVLDDVKNIDFTTFHPYLKQVAAKKGFRQQV